MLSLVGGVAAMAPALSRPAARLEIAAGACLFHTTSVA